ncbi:MAG: 4Fe-4S binding protein [Desulfuromonadaceae bacterium]|nr:4Fe-4S binding protein [Desulfuromonadaceae bacterium]MDD2849933.1 4Fe-4S binding protein [Desulfuromonadaceae bacterium]MDD4130878.1 4Fe-4S binding protein [Desulfuromonadaceae bacterium]
MKNYKLPIVTTFVVFITLAMIELMVKKPLLLLDRFSPGAGWLQVILVSSYAFVVAYNMHDPAKTALWRRRTWLLFSTVFFGQLLLGLFASPIFLMSGTLHLPIPAMIVAAPLYRGEPSMMTILFLSTIALSGPAWCSHICYFGGIDALVATGKTQKKVIKNKFKIKHAILIVVIAASLLFRLCGVPPIWAGSVAFGFGLAGVAVIYLLSRKQGKMMHCIMYCPIGTIIQYAKRISPFRMRIEQNCSACGRCSNSCKYDALNREDILNHKPGLSCTLCGDCITSCHSSSIKYKFLNLPSAFSRNAWLSVSIALHAITLALARI